MNYGPVIYSKLSGHGALTALVGDRIGNIKVKQNEQMPYLVYRQSLSADHTKMPGAHKLDYVQVEVRVVTDQAEAVDKAFTVAVEVIAAMEQYVELTVEGEVVKQIVFENQGYQVYNEENKAFETPLNFEMKIWKG